MIEGLVLLILVCGTLLPFGRERHPLRTRLAWMTVAMGVGISARLPNPFLAVMGALVFLNVWRHDKPSSLVMTHLYPSLAFLGAYGLLAPHVSTALIPWVLWAMVGMGCWMGVWVACSVAWLPLQCTTSTTPVTRSYRRGIGPPMGLLWVYETDSIQAGQANPNHLDSLASLNVAACVGLYLIGYTWAVVLLPLVAFPILALVWWPRGRSVQPEATRSGLAHALTAIWEFRRPTMGVVNLVTLGLALVAITVRHGWLWSVAGSLVAFSSLARYNGDRLKTWGTMLTLYWWQQSWSVKLLGCGTDSWANLHNWHLANHQNPESRFLYESAHNEYVQQVVEYGVIGFAAMVGYCVSALWFAAQAGPTGQAVYLVGAVMVSIAFLHFPWTFFHQIQLKNLQGKMQTYEHGSPGLLAYSLVLVLMLETVC